MNIIRTDNINSAGSCAIVLKAYFDICFNTVGKFILIFLHHLYNLFLYVNSSVDRALVQCKHLRTSVNTDYTSDDVFLKNEVLLLRKIPKHLTIIVSNEPTSYQDLVKIINWCLSSGISFISFYDHRNGINSEVLFEYMCNHAKQYIPAIKWGKSFSEDIKHLSKNCINGYKWEPRTCVHIYRRNDWENALMDCISGLESEDCDNINENVVDSILKKWFLAPDPELCLITGNVLSFFGFPPWQLRITQIQEIPSHHNITVQLFLDALKKYSTCEQRYGK